jgi:hypothetical protein
MQPHAFVLMYIHICFPLCLCMYVCMCVCVCMYVHIYACICMCVCVCVCVYVCMYVPMYVCIMHACMHACMYVCMCNRLTARLLEGFKPSEDSRSFNLRARAHKSLDFRGPNCKLNCFAFLCFCSHGKPTALSCNRPTAGATLRSLKRQLAL